MARTKIKAPQLDLTPTTDANGWLVRDFGAFKIATKVRTWSVASMGSGAAAFATLSDTNSPVGYSSGFTTATIVVGSGGAAGNFEANWESNGLVPGSNFVVRNNSGGTAGTSGSASYLVIF